MENMYAQFSTHLPGILIDGEAKRITVDLAHYDPEAFYTAVLGEDLDHLHLSPERLPWTCTKSLTRSMPKGIKAIKGQVTGPISCGLQVFDQNGKSALYDETTGR